MFCMSLFVLLIFPIEEETLWDGDEIHNAILRSHMTRQKGQ